jgi:hypothetical protein
MDKIPPREEDYTIDLERGGSPAIDELPTPSPSTGGKLSNTFISKFRELMISNETENPAISSGNIVKMGEVSPENLKIAVDNKLEQEESVGKKKNKKGSAKKPPRPPRGLSLDAADQKLIKEITEIAMLKRARVERMKAVKKMRASKASSSSSSGNVIAMLFTVLFCLVILFQGMCSGNSGVGFEGSPKSSQGEGGLISVTNHLNPYLNLPVSGSPSLVEQVAGLNSEHKKGGRAAR